MLFLYNIHSTINHYFVSDHRHYLCIYYFYWYLERINNNIITNAYTNAVTTFY